MSYLSRLKANCDAKLQMNVPPVPVQMASVRMELVQINGHVCAILDGQLLTATVTSMNAPLTPVLYTAYALMGLAQTSIVASAIRGGMVLSVISTSMNANPVLVCMAIALIISTNTTVPASLGTLESIVNPKSWNANQIHVRMVESVWTSSTSTSVTVQKDSVGLIVRMT